MFASVKDGLLSVVDLEGVSEWSGGGGVAHREARLYTRFNLERSLVQFLITQPKVTQIVIHYFPTLSHSLTHKLTHSLPH